MSENENRLAEAAQRDSAPARAVRRTTSQTRAFIDALRITAAPLALAFAAAFLFIAPDQIRDIYRAQAELVSIRFLLPPEARDPLLDGAGWTRSLFGILAIGLLATTLAAACRYATRRLAPLEGDPGPRPALWFLRVAPGIAFALPILGYLSGLFFAFTRAPVPPAETIAALSQAGDVARLRALGQIGDLSALLSANLQWTAALLAAFALLLGVFAARPPDLDGRDAGPSVTGRMTRRGVVAATGLSVVAALTFLPVAVPQTVGVIALIALFLTLVTVVLTQLSIWSQRFTLSLISWAVIGVLLLSALGVTDNHRIRRLGDLPAVGAPDDLPPPDALPTAEDAFVAWLTARADLQAFEGRAYPVYIVAAQGGGAYAAAHAVQFLRRAQATCPRFNQHFFAISGVSGGSVGGAFVSAMAARYSENTPDLDCAETPPSFEETGVYTRLGMAMVSQDFFAPLVAGALFPDALQRVTPLPIERWSRARALEKSFEAAWAQGHARVDADPGPEADNPMSGGLAALWRPDGAAPAPLFNTTEVGSGRRRLIAPFRIVSEAGDMTMFPLSAERDIALSTAAGLSARFPWVTPAGWFYDRNPEDPESLRAVRLVDGGYFENSGVATALDLIISLEARLAEEDDLPEVEFILIALTTERAPQGSTAALSEFLDPVRALLSARRARKAIAIAGAEKRLGATPDGRPRLRRVNVEDLLLALPLGWRLSEVSRLQIAIQSGDARSCPAVGALGLTAGQRPPTLRADCVLRLIYEELR